MPLSYIASTVSVEDSLVGLTQKQKYVVSKVIQTKECPCGCKMGTISVCRIKDPDCKTSARMLSQAVQLALQGKDAEAILAQYNTTSAQKKPEQVTMIPYRPDDPQRGPAFAKVTMIVFSDFL